MRKNKPFVGLMYEEIRDDVYFRHGGFIINCGGSDDLGGVATREDFNGIDDRLYAPP